MELPPYLRLDQEDSEGPSRFTDQHSSGGPSSSITSNPMHGATSSSGTGEAYVLRVLFKESKVEIATLRPTSTVLELKTAIEKHTETPVGNQRLIFSGKHLTPDNKLLSDFNISSQSSIHLFPRPTAALPVDQTDSSPARPRILRVQRVSHPPGAAFADYDSIGERTGVHATVPEVRLWCYILFFYSFMTLFNHMSFLINTGTLGHGILDGVVAILETIFSVCGIYVSYHGLKATETVNREDVKRYVYMLVALTVCVILSRVLWIIDMVMQAKIGIKKEVEKEEEEEESGEKTDDPYTDDYYGGSHKLDPTTLLFYFSVQVVIMAFIYSSMWVFCVTRAIRFRNAVEESALQDQAATTV